METINNQDTPQPQTANTNTGMDAFGAPTDEGSENNNLSVEDAFFSKAEPDNQSAPEEGQPIENQEQVQTEQPYEAKNDDKRFEYWQSQAAKKDNELGVIKGKINKALQARQAQSQQRNPQEQKQIAEQFPPAPPKPGKPRSFSREEAWSDPSSESAKYLDDVDTWNDSISEYRDLRNQYELAVLKENMQNQEEAKRVENIKRAQYAQNQHEQQEIYEHVQGHYGLNPDDASEFIHTMSDPKSISMDNLVQLFRMNKGVAPVPQQATGPSDAFQQTRNAQQVPSPMGVMPGQSTSQNRSDEDSIMDDLITSHKSKNPWT